MFQRGERDEGEGGGSGEVVGSEKVWCPLSIYVTEAEWSHTVITVLHAHINGAQARRSDGLF